MSTAFSSPLSSFDAGLDEVDFGADRQIAQLLGLQDVTVKMHKKHVMTKLGASNLIHLFVAGRALGMLPQLDAVAEPA